VSKISDGVALLHLDDFDFDAFALHHKGHEDHEALDPSDAIAPERDGGDVGFHVLANLKVRHSVAADSMRDRPRLQIAPATPAQDTQASNQRPHPGNHKNQDSEQSTPN
jgi:hypothetical protein